MVGVNMKKWESEQMKIGDYIRTKQWGIAKVNRIYLGKCSQIKNNHNRLTHHFEQIGETSPDIIDVIEVGDLVNGYLIVGIGIDPFNKKKILRTSVDRCDCWGDRSLVQFHNEDIEIVVTREQLKDCKYEVNK